MLTLLPLDAPTLDALCVDPAAAIRPLGRSSAAMTAVIRDVAQDTAVMLAGVEERAPWTSYLARRDADRALVGTCAFKGPPVGGAVEIAYFTYPAFEHRGVATAMARGLLAIAAGAGAVEVLAHTEPRENASVRLLRRLGFAWTGTVEDGGGGDGDDQDGHGPVWRWALSLPGEPA